MKMIEQLGTVSIYVCELILIMHDNYELYKEHKSSTSVSFCFVCGCLPLYAFKQACGVN